MSNIPPIRVALCTNSIAMGGMENHVLELATQIAKLGCEVSAIVPDVPEIAAFHDGLRDRGIPVDLITLQGQRSWVRFGSEALRLRRLLQQRRVDVFHQHRTGPYHGKWACLAARSAGARAIIATEHLPPFPLRGISRFLNQSADRCVDRIVTVCEADRARQVRDTWRSTSKVCAIHNGIDFSRLEPVGEFDNKPDLQRQLGVEGQGPVLGVVARLSPEKGHIYLLRALPSLVQRWPGLIVLLAGEGPERASLEAETRLLGLAANVRFLGQRSDVTRLLRAIDLLVLPSLKESFPISLLEAMAMACPAVATDVGGVAEAVIDGQTGLVVPSGDPAALAAAIARCLDERTLEHMGAAGHARVRRLFGSDLMARKTVDLYRAALAD